MAFETRDNSGALFKNSRKERENHPDYTGDGMVNGQKVRISAWLKTARSGSKFLSLSFSEPRDAGQVAEGRRAAPLPNAGASHAGLDDDIPFAPER